jgi:hypothetical protein
VDQVDIQFIGDGWLDVLIGRTLRQPPESLVRQVFDPWGKANAEQMRDPKDEVCVYVDKSSFSLLFTQ